VRFADGREGGRKGPIIGQEPTRKDEHGLPLDPIVRPTGGGGGAHAYHFGAWVFPLPPDGPLEIYVSLPAVSPAEGHVALDGSDVRAAASHAKVIWS
jgi:hypothetical protein